MKIESIARKLRSLVDKVSRNYKRFKFEANPIEELDQELDVMVVGAGSIASSHLDVLYALKEVNVRTICNRGGKGIKKLAQKYDIPHVSSDWKKSISKRNPDAVFVLVHWSQVYTVTEDILRRGIPCLVEKPPGTEPAQTRRLESLAADNNVVSMVGLNRRFYSSVRKGLAKIGGKDAINAIHLNRKEKVFEYLNKGDCTGEEADKWLTLNAIHYLDLFRYLGGEIDEVKGYRHLDEATDYQCGFSLAVSFKNGTTGTINSHWKSAWEPEQLVMHGENVRVELSPLEKGQINYSSGTNETLDLEKEDRLFKPGFYRQARTFFRAVAGDASVSPGADFSDAAKTMEFLSDIEKLTVAKRI